MDRPYFNKSLAELRQLFEAHSGDEPVLRRLLHELSARKKSPAKRLQEQVSGLLDELTSPTHNTILDGENADQVAEETISREANNASEQGNLPNSPSKKSPAGRLSGELFGSETESYGPLPDDLQRPRMLTRIRPPGTKGLPDAYERKRSRDISLNLPPNADLPQTFVAALDQLIREIKRTGAGQKRYDLEKGRRIEVAGGEFIYSFVFLGEAELFEDAQIEIQIAGRRVPGTIVSIGANRLVLALKEDIGLDVASVALLIDATVLLAALKDKIEKVGKGEITLNRKLADAVIGKKAWPAEDAPVISAPHVERLNSSQRNAFRRATSDQLTYIWGPPGCGKTLTLGEVVKATLDADKRILICSNTNKAVDQVLYQLCKTLGRDNKYMDEGKIVRLGRIVDDKLESQFAEYVTLDGIAERLAVDLKARKRHLEDQVSRIDQRVEPARQIVLQFDQLDQAERRVLEAEEVTNRHAREGREAQEELTRTHQHHSNLVAELERRRNAILTFLRRSEEAIQADIRNVRADIDKIGARVLELKPLYVLSRQAFAKAQHERDTQQFVVAGKDRAAAQKAIDQANKERAVLVTELREIEAKMSALRESIVRDAKVIGATCTKAYLSHSDIGQVDLVIVDEASMVMLPVVWFSAGLARERVVVSGDFRQIPPIVPTEQEAIFEVLGKSAFEAAGLADPDDARLAMLDQQYRMHPEICDLIASPMYQGLLHTAADRKSASSPSPPSPFDRPLTIVDTSDLWPFEGQTPFFSRFNMLHALLVRNLVSDLKARGIIAPSHPLGVCTPYAAQSRMIQKLLEGEGLDEAAQVGTVHSYQGDERKIILLDIPESHGGAWNLGQFVQGLPPKHVGARLINVAVSRAQDHLIVLANLTYLDKRLPSTSLLREILFKMQERGCVVPGNEVLKLRPIERDLAGLVGRMDFDEVVETLAIFDEKQFERALTLDIRSAEKSIVLFSGYITPARVGKIVELLRLKIIQGVKVRCVTRPPRGNGSIPEAAGRQAIEMLEGIGVVVDCRSNIHQKVCLVDDRIVWWGSLNALSHMYHSDETMTRAVNHEFAAIVAAHMSKRQVSPQKAASTVADAENPRCPDCRSRTVLGESKFGPFFYCEASCGWKQSLKAEARPGRPQSNDLPKSGPPCPICKKETRLRRGRHGEFYGCIGFPECKGIAKPPSKSADATRPKRTAKSKRP